ncbi:MAG: NAD+ synthase [Chitinophagales bacterium]|nr:NAD+ synthase [Chitinophagales bacterium]
MKIGIAQQNYIIGDFEGNLAQIKSAIDTAYKQQADILLFPEMSVCGYPSYDLNHYSEFVARSFQFVEKIADYTKNKLAVVVGAPNTNTLAKDKPYNSAYFIADGDIQQIVHKIHLSKREVFNEKEYYSSTNTTKLIQYKGKKFLLHIGDDRKNILLSDSSEINKILNMKPDFILNISATPFEQDSYREKRNYIKRLAVENKLPVFYCNTYGAQVPIIFDGGSMVVNADGAIFEEMSFFKEEIRIFDLEKISKSGNNENLQPVENIALVHDALVLGIKDFFLKSGFRKAVLGLSGGVDSALVLVLAVKALGAENVLSVLMPSEYSSDHSVKDALDLVKNLNSPHQIVPIHSTFETFNNTLAPIFEGKKQDVTEENLQARIRGVLLMAISNKLSHIVLNSSNKSEVAVGYGTLYGDTCGALAAIADLYKTQIYELCKYINREQEIIPHHILVKSPSAELSPNQKDSDSLPPYDILDEVLCLYIENNLSEEQILLHGYDTETVKKIIGLVRRAEFKRHQSVPVLKISKRSFVETHFPLVKRNF